MAVAFPFRLGQVALDGKSTLPAIKYQGASFSLNAVDSASAGRNQSGTMIRDMVTTKIKWQLEFVPCNQTQLSNLLNAISGSFFEFTYPDPLKASGTSTKTFYVGDRSAPVWEVDRTNESAGLWGNVKMDFIER